MASSFLWFLGHTERPTTVGRTPVKSDHPSQRPLLGNTPHSRQTYIQAPVEIRTLIPANERLQTHALEHATNEIGFIVKYLLKFYFAGLMMESEKKIFEMMDEKTEMSKYWMPLIWATNIINRARKESLIPNDHVVQTILVELSDIRRRLGSVIGYDTVCVPLVYTQVSGWLNF